MLYEDIFISLNKRKVRYLVVGDIALMLHGVVKLNADLDLMVNLEDNNLARFISAMKGLSYRQRVPVKPEEFVDPLKRETWEKEKGVRVFSFYDLKKPMGLVDVFVDGPIEYEKLERDRIKIKTGGITIPVISKKHLIQLKKMSGRPQDIADIKALKELMKLEKKGISIEKH
ncbi:MAG: hypothetical protein A2Y97_13635 [Nitrospirae bacterium RBG_13_39_12]|nr:MAG: hypothetical protein A2Y97_13635 [Nitrospirae bacterium RBG_13_39_12]